MHESLQLRRVERAAEFAVGDFCIEPKDGDRYYLVVRLPGEEMEGTWQIRKVAGGFNDAPLSAPGGPWIWNGNFEKPSFRPSLWHIGVWHGVITDGFAQSVGSA